MSVVATSEKIAKAARRLLEKGGVEAVTVRSVAGWWGLRRWRCIGTMRIAMGCWMRWRTAGFEELVARLAAKRLKGEPEARIYQLLDVYVEHALEQPRMFELMFLRPRKGARQFPQDFEEGRSPTANFMAKLLLEGMETGEFRKDDAWEMVFEMGALFQGLVMLYLGGRVGMTPEQFRGLCKRSFRRYLHGIRDRVRT